MVKIYLDIGMRKFIQMYSNGSGDYTEERNDILKDVGIEDFEIYLKEHYDEN